MALPPLCHFDLKNGFPHNFYYIFPEHYCTRNGVISEEKETIIVFRCVTIRSPGRLRPIRNARTAVVGV